MISVILPVYNCSNFIENSISSVLNQTITDFELIIIDNASTDNTLEIIQEISDSRIKLVTKKINSGLVDSLNIGLKMASGDFIARMDADDICMPKRFEYQLKQFKRKEVAICGTGAFRFNGNHKKKIHVYKSNLFCKAILFFGSPFVHPSVMYRAEALSTKKYRNLFSCEDYGFWIDNQFSGEYVNIKNKLLYYRDNLLGMSNSCNSDKSSFLKRDKDFFSAITRQYKKYGAVLNSLEINTLRHLYYSGKEGDVDSISFDYIKRLRVSRKTKLIIILITLKNILKCQNRLKILSCFFKDLMKV